MWLTSGIKEFEKTILKIKDKFTDPSFLNFYAKPG